MEQPDTEVQDSAVPAQPAASEPTEQIDDAALAEGLDDQQPEADEEEVDYEGEKFKVPKKLKDALLRQADYTRKTQEVAQQRAAIEQEREAVQRAAAVQQQFLEEVATVKALDKQIEQYRAINWDALDEADPVQARKLERQLRTLQEQRSQIAQAVAAKHQERLSQEQQVTAKQLAEGAEVLKREIRDWSPQKAEALNKYGVDYGFSPQAMSQITNPLVVKLLHDSYTLAQLRKNAQQKPKPEAQEAPVTRISATRTTANKDPDRMSPDEWLKWRNAQIKRSK